MGFRITDRVDRAAPTRTRLPRRHGRTASRRRTPRKNRVWDFCTTFATHAGKSAVQPVEPHRDTFDTTTISVSGALYYGFRFYSPQLGRWLSRDPLGDHASFAARDLRAKLLRQMIEKVRNVLKTIRDESQDKWNRQKAVADEINLVEGIRALQTGDPSYNLRWNIPFCGGLNNYAFCRNDSIDLIDINGLGWWDDLLGVLQQLIDMIAGDPVGASPGAMLEVGAKACETMPAVIRRHNETQAALDQFDQDMQHMRSSGPPGILPYTNNPSATGE